MYDERILDKAETGNVTPSFQRLGGISLGKMDVLSTRSNYRGSPHLDSLALACVSLLTNKEKAIILIKSRTIGGVALTKPNGPRAKPKLQRDNPYMGLHQRV
ncbi:hypothetical protein PCANC_06848 [Puccinia coronata f. sp. avenae]|uniref:Uncharacterized protein n=1 Tax=Puccinia coronata f. sp. avenae TaxID=200324 RepID=A0A2N5VVI6_9BASI|nr:hypothetical protein PCANC_06848 [Puccinia coronata f. sp. avenae]